MKTATACVLFLVVLLAGCDRREPVQVASNNVATAPARPTPTTAKTLESPVTFSDVTAATGIRWKHNSGAFGLKLMPETMGSGVAWIDFDGDGDQDLFLVNGRYWTRSEGEQYRRGTWSRDEHTIFSRTHPIGTPHQRSLPARFPTQGTTGALYRNNGDGTFKDVTAGSGLEIEMQGMGAAVGDYDNDGRADLLVTSLGHNYLFRNQSTLKGARFAEVANASGVRGNGWGTSAAWLDYDRDGKLDLYVCRYVDWTPGNDRFGTINGRDKSYTAPFFYKGQRDLLFHNQGGGRFADVSKRAGIALPRLKGKALGVAVCDVNEDDWPDVLVAVDGEPNLLFENRKNGTFAEVAQRAGIALDSTGDDRAGMGIDTADVDHSNRDSVVIGNFDAEMIGYYYNGGKGSFSDIGAATEVGQASRTFSTFGCVFLDADNDTWPDLLTASGHIDPQIDGIRGTAYALRPLFFWNQGRGEFREVGQSAGATMQVPRVGRGLAYADYDLDGDLDVVMTVNNAAPVLWRNDSRTANKNHSIRLILRGRKSNGSGIGALVKVKFSEQDGLRRWVRSGSSYLSQSELPLTLGIGPRDKVLLITVRWPSGKFTRLRDVKADQILLVDEDKGLVQSRALVHKTQQ